MLVGGADLDKVLALWEEEQMEEGGSGRGRGTLSSTDSRTNDVRGSSVGTGVAVSATIGQDVVDEDPYWDHVLSRTRERAGKRYVP